MKTNRSTAALIALVSAPTFSAETVVQEAIAKLWGALSPSNHYVAGSAEVVLSSHGGEPWLSFDLDEMRAGSFFRVNYSVFLSASGKPREIFCSAPAGMRHESYGLTVGAVAGA